MSNVIRITNIIEYAELVAALTKQKLVFIGGRDARGWFIEITGYSK